jgi:uncharacterized membrane protein
MPTHDRPGAARTRSTTIPRRFGWWLFLAVCTFYGAFAVSLAAVEVFSWTGAVKNARERAVPVVFVAHALTGGIALVVGALQLNRRIRARNRKLHRVLGRVYVGAIWTASAGGLWIALYFNVTLAARLMFVLAATLWFAATTTAFRHIRHRRIAAHREWMIRSFALSLFFVTFELWVAGLKATGLPESIAYPLSIGLSWSVNLVIAERWIRSTRPGRRRHPVSHQPDRKVAQVQPAMANGSRLGYRPDPGNTSRNLQQPTTRPS